jgi:hypothetical protein
MAQTINSLVMHGAPSVAAAATNQQDGIRSRPSGRSREQLSE